MAFTASTHVVKLGYMPGLKVEVGNIAFTTTATSGDVQTTLSFVTAVIATTTTGKLVCTAPVGAVAAGSITFTRADGTSSADIMNYVLFGY
jgi:hypothetical protein